MPKKIFSRTETNNLFPLCIAFVRGYLTDPIGSPDTSSNASVWVAFHLRFRIHYSLWMPLGIANSLCGESLTQCLHGVAFSLKCEDEGESPAFSFDSHFKELLISNQPRTAYERHKTMLTSIGKHWASKMFGLNRTAYELSKQSPVLNGFGVNPAFHYLAD